MQGKKLMLAKALNGLGLLRLLNSGRRFNVLCYHRIAASPEVIEQAVFDGSIYNCTAQEFARHLQWLKRNSRILGLDEMLRLLRGEDLGKGPYSMVTFDDAYVDCCSVAYEVLKDMQVQAVVFVPSKLIDERLLGWWDLLAYVLKNTAKPEIEWDGSRFRPRQDYHKVFKFFLQKMKLAPNRETRNLVESLAAECEVEPPNKELQSAELMTWEQIGKISRDVFAIGSHTHSHRVLATITPVEQKDEICRSKEIIEQKISQPVRSIAFPVGGPAHYNQASLQAARECGYEAAFSFGTGSNRDWREINPFDIHRFEPAVDPVWLAGQCAWPNLFLR